MSDACLTKPCAACGKRIRGVSWHCAKCGICFCFYCGIQLALRVDGPWPLECPACGAKFT